MTHTIKEIEDAIEGCNYKAIKSAKATGFCGDWVTTHDTINCYNPKHNPVINKALEAYKQSLEPVEDDALEVFDLMMASFKVYNRFHLDLGEDALKRVDKDIELIRNQLTRQGEVEVSRFNEQGLVEGLFKQYIPPEKCSDDMPFMTENEIHSYNLAVKTLYENGQLETQPQKQVDVESLIAKYSHSVYPDCRDLDSDTPFARTMRELSSKGYFTKPQPIEKDK